MVSYLIWDENFFLPPTDSYKKSNDPSRLFLDGGRDSVCLSPCARLTELTGSFEKLAKGAIICLDKGIGTKTLMQKLRILIFNL